MALVPAATFVMGDEDGVSDERPAHLVEVRGFLIDTHEVSTAALARCVEAGACASEGVKTTSEEEACNTGAEGREGHPANCVTWEVARSYCEWAGKRLPTEAEWEYAAGAGTDRRFPWGNRAPHCDRTCRKDGEPGCGTGTTCALGAHPADVSPFGVVALGGNVAEWVGDWYDAEYYERSPRLAPTGPEAGERRSVRGGDFTDTFDPFRVASRGRLAPELRAANVGFRCARSL